MKKEKSSNVYNIAFNHDQTFKEMIKAGEYDWHNSYIDIVFEKYLTYEIGQRNIEITLSYYQRREHLHDLINEMDAKGYRLATCGELLALGAQHPNLQREFIISTHIYINNIKFVLYIGEWGCERGLDLDLFKEHWYQDCRCAFVLKG